MMSSGTGLDLKAGTSILDARRHVSDLFSWGRKLGPRVRLKGIHSVTGPTNKSFTL